MSQTVLQTAIENAKTSSTEWNDPFTEMCRELATDSSCYEDWTGDALEWTWWACLFEFNPEEIAELIQSGILESHGINPLKPLFVTYSEDDSGFRNTTLSRHWFDEIAKNYQEFTSKKVCPLCDDEKYSDDDFCGGSKCDSEDHTHEGEPCSLCVARFDA